MAREEPARGRVLEFRVTDRILLKRIKRAATLEAQKLYHITGGFVHLGQDPEMRRLWEEGMVEL
ncbi:MAG: hypothetical protein JRI59_05600 [Deltaproteobacteria bacterium]|nr:hypothetical protein [Deltaproteobacteria bacterium]